MRLTLKSLVDLRFALVICAALCGCNRTPTVPKVLTLPVTGKVTLDGKPLAGANVVFMISDPPTPFFAMTKDDGTYQLQAPEGREALLKGPCKVTISRMLKPDGSPLAEGEVPAMVQAVESLPAKYSQFDQTSLSQTVAAEGGAIDFELTSK